MEIIEKKDFKEIKLILRENIPYTLYKEFINIYETNKEELLENTFFYYLCYLSEEEFYKLKEKIEEKLNKKFSFIYTKIPLFNSNKETNKNKENITVIKPKIEHGNLSKEKIIELINIQEKKDKEKIKDI